MYTPLHSTEYTHAIFQQKWKHNQQELAPSSTKLSIAITNIMFEIFWLSGRSSKPNMKDSYLHSPFLIGARPFLWFFVHCWTMLLSKTDKTTSVPKKMWKYVWNAFISLFRFLICIELNALASQHSCRPKASHTSLIFILGQRVLNSRWWLQNSGLCWCCSRNDPFHNFPRALLWEK